MVLVREDEQLSRDAFHASSIEGRHALCGIDAIVLLAVDDKDRCVPLVHKAMGRVLVGLLGTCCLVFVPVGIVVLPVREPVFLSLSVHRFKVESAIVSNETLKALVVVTCQIVNGETAKRSTNSAKTVLVDIRQVVACKVDG